MIIYHRAPFTDREIERLKSRFFRAQQRGKIRILDLPVRTRLRMFVNRIKTRLILAWLGLVNR